MIFKHQFGNKVLMSERLPRFINNIKIIIIKESESLINKELEIPRDYFSFWRIKNGKRCNSGKSCKYCAWDC